MAERSRGWEARRGWKEGSGQGRRRKRQDCGQLQPRVFLLPSLIHGMGWTVAAPLPRMSLGPAGKACPAPPRVKGRRGSTFVPTYPTMCEQLVTFCRKLWKVCNSTTLSS